MGHMPLMMVSTKEGLGLVRHFLTKPGTNGVVNVCGKAVNRGGGLGMEIPCEYIFTGPHKLIECLEKCLQKTQLSVKIVFQVKMSRRKEVEKGKQQLESLQRIRNLDGNDMSVYNFFSWKTNDTVIV